MFMLFLLCCAMLPAVPATVPMTVIVQDQNGQAIPKAKVSAFYTIGHGAKAYRSWFNGTTDPLGIATVKRPADLSELKVSVTVDGYATVYRKWDVQLPNDLRAIPMLQQFQLPRLTTIGGRVVDAKGRGVANVLIELMAQPENKTETLGQGVEVAPVYLNKMMRTALSTNAQGYWVCDLIPDVPIEVSLKLSHHDFIPDREFIDNRLREPGITNEQLRAGKAILKMKRGATLSGTITDPKGQPIPKAFIVFNDKYEVYRVTSHTSADAQGNYELKQLMPGRRPITVIAKGFAPEQKFIDVKAGQQKLDFKLQPGKSLKLKFVDQAAKPVAVKLKVISWRDGQSLRSPSRADNGIPNQADDNGFYEWNGAPADALRFQAEAKEYQQTEFTIIADGTLQTIVIRRTPIVTGTVIDATTGKPIEKFKVLEVSEYSSSYTGVDRYGFSDKEINYLKDGKFTIKLSDGVRDHSIMIEAPGYRTALSPPHLVANGITEVTFPMIAGPPVAGRILSLDGKPCSNIKIGLGTRVDNLTFKLDILSFTVKTDAQGRFHFPAQSEPFMLFAETQQGFIHRRFEPDAKVGDLVVEPGITITGTLRHNGKPLRNHSVSADSSSFDEEKTEPFVMLHDSTDTDAEGEFELHLPALDYARLNYDLPQADGSNRAGRGSIPFLTHPGGRYHFDIGKTGANLVGKLDVAQSRFKNLDFQRSRVMLVSRQPEVPYPPEWADDDYDLADDGQDALTYNRRLALHRGINLQPSETGSFSMPLVPAGDYWLTVELNHTEVNARSIVPVATSVVPITVSTKQANDKETVKLPKLMVKVPPALPLGQPLPELKLKDANGKTINLSRYRGQALLLHAWHSDTAKNPLDFAQLRQLRKQVPDAELAIIGLNFDWQPSDALKVIADESLNWPQALNGYDNDLILARMLRIGTVPYYFLLDREGKLIYNGSDIATVRAKLLK